MYRTAISINATLFVGAIISELTGISPIAAWREGRMYDVIEATGSVEIFLALYIVFVFVFPAVNLVALLVRKNIFSFFK